MYVIIVLIQDFMSVMQSWYIHIKNLRLSINSQCERINKKQFEKVLLRTVIENK